MAVGESVLKAGGRDFVEDSLDLDRFFWVVLGDITWGFGSVMLFTLESL